MQIYDCHLYVNLMASFQNFDFSYSNADWSFKFCSILEVFPLRMSRNGQTESLIPSLLESQIEECLAYESTMCIESTLRTKHKERRQNYYFTGCPKSKDTGCSLNIVFFSKDFRIFRTLAFLCFPLMSVCVHTPGR